MLFNLKLSATIFILFDTHTFSAFCPAGSSEPSPCAAGTFSTEIALSSNCSLMCGLGQFSTNGATACHECYRGTIAKSRGTAICSQCGEGMVM